MDISVDKAIADLDLEPIKRKLMRSKPGAEWSPERADAAESEYRRFLFLMKMFPNELSAPSIDVDRFWHHHIVDTAKYARDCETVFGYFLHRYPYLGMGGEHDASRLLAGQRMRELYRKVFGEGSDEYTSLGTGFARAIQATFPAQAREPRNPWPGFEERGKPDEPDDARGLLDQLRFVVIENQRWDRVAEPVM